MTLELTNEKKTLVLEESRLARQALRQTGARQFLAQNGPGANLVLGWQVKAVWAVAG